MAEVETTNVRAPEPVTVSVVRVKHLRGQKGDVVTVVIKAEFGDKVLGESQKIDCTGESSTSSDINFNAILNCAYNDGQALDEIAHKPVVLTLIEVLPKEKRQKEEKTHLLGQCTVDLLPLVRGETKACYTLPINPTPGSPLESLQVDCPRPEVDVNITVQVPLLVDKNLKDGNLMRITMENLHCPPESWTLSGIQYYYAAALPIPITEEREVPIVFANGQLKPGSDKELPNKQKKWCKPGNAQGLSVFIPDSFVVSDPIEDEDGDYKNKEDREFRHCAEMEKNHVSWITERRCFLDSSAIKKFQDEIAKNRLWPVEVMRLAVQASGGKGKKEDENGIYFHGIAFVNLAPLLYPGVKKIRGAYKVWPYSDHILYEKTKRKSGMSEEASKIAMNILHHNSTSPPPKKGGKEPEKKDVKKGASQLVKSDTGSELDGQPPLNVEGQMYVEAKSFVILEIVLDRPLIPKRQPEELARKVSEYIPPRPLFPKRTDGAKRAVEDYHAQISNVADLILDEFRELFGDDATGQLNVNEAMETNRQKLIYELNSSGKYFAFKEQLKHSVVKIVREKYLKTTIFDDREELQTFLSELYVYLVDQMHLALGNALEVGDRPPVPKPVTESAQLKHFAREAEMGGNFELAARYYQERIAKEKKNADNWYDYGIFNLYINEVTKAEECFKECISIKQNHLYGILMYGVVCSLLERNDEAETFFEAATNINPKCIKSWTMFGLFYDSIGNDIGAEMAYMEANKLNHSEAAATAKAIKAELKEKSDFVPQVLEGEQIRDSEALGDGEVSFPKSPSPDRTPLTSAISESTDDKRETDKVNSPGASVSVSRTHSQQRVGKQPVTPQPTHIVKAIPSRDPTPLPACSIYMHTIEWLLESKAAQFAERALAHEILLPRPAHSTTAIEYQIALARLNLQKRKFREAEVCLKKALELEQQNPDGWSLMGHLKYLTGDTEAARECFERTISFIGEALEMHSIYIRLASIYLSEQKFQNAKNMFLMACRKSPSCVSWLGVGIACYRLNELTEAEDALSEANILNNSDAEVWGYLSLVCLKSARQLEAEQTYKYAMKLNLQDKDLLAEIHKVQKQVGFGNPQF
ncbi:cilia- and flagella-associated protein 70 [Patella vulgata]|uniref:cilia- and flagella-associated protein 70 n=1 Tax=Patella vulgata TaxID=6465 RepID=UPI00217F3E07|nr:cilia- and flagella-associated protein 70 [Patella vulgata]